MTKKQSQIENRQSSIDKEQSQIENRKFMPQVSKINRWSFPTVSPCPRCGGTNTQAVSTQKNIQYRVCRSAICRHRYTVRGQKVDSE